MNRSLDNLKYIIKPIWDESPTYVLLNVIYSFQNIPSRLLNVLVIEYIVNIAVSQENFDKIIKAGLLYLSYNLTMIIIKYVFNELYKCPMEEKIRKKLKYDLYVKSLKFDISSYDDIDYYDKYVKAFSVTDEKCFSVFNKLIRLLGAVLSIGTLLSVIISLSPLVIIVSIIGCTMSLLANFYKGKLAYKKDREITPIQRKINYIDRIFFLKQYSSDLRVENISNILFGYYDKEYIYKIKSIKKYGKKNTIASIFFESPLEITDIFMWIYIAWQISCGILEAGSFMALSNAAWSLSNQLRNLFNLFPQLYEDSLFVENIRVWDLYCSNIENKKNAKKIKNEIIEKIEILNCDFKYNKEEKFSIENINISMNKGDRIAIVGHNGAGKSTLVKLLLRLYDPSKGEISINNINYKDYKIEDLRNCFSVVFQDYQYYCYTIAENILMKTPDNKEEENLIWEVLKKVDLYEKVRGMKNGIYTFITKEFNSEGEIFSGGELQRIIIARALIKDTPIVILDEPSSALDPIAESELNDLLLNLFQDKILVIISHKLSMTKDCNKIVLLDKGQIIEYGSHQELLSLNKKYAKMWNLQSQKYIITNNE
ncbi:MAG: ABC transporter ATP-binding protein [Clostridium sp.]